MFDVMITLTEEQRKRAEARATELGYSDPRDYLHDLLEEALENDEPIDVIAGIREGLEDIRDGRVYPAADLDALLDTGHNPFTRANSLSHVATASTHTWRSASVSSDGNGRAAAV